MKSVTQFENKKVLVLGLAKSGEGRIYGRKLQ